MCETGRGATPPAHPRPRSRTTAVAAGYWHSGKAGVVDDTWTMPKEAGIRVSPCWRRKLSNKVLRSSTSESGTSCCAESISQWTRLARCGNDLESIIAKHFDMLFFEGEQPTRRMNILGAVSHFLPRYCRQDDRGRQRSYRALKGRTLPGRSRTPEPMAV